MKRKTAKEILAESFRELAEKKKVDKITVRDIAENCGYSTTTFYRHFKDKYDLIVWEHTQYVSEIMDRVGKDGYSWNQTLYEGMEYYEKNKEYLANLLQHTSGYDSFIRNMAEINCNALKKCKCLDSIVVSEDNESYSSLDGVFTTKTRRSYITSRQWSN